jgi:hypothetical protein
MSRLFMGWKIESKPRFRLFHQYSLLSNWVIIMLEAGSSDLQQTSSGAWEEASWYSMGRIFMDIKTSICLQEHKKGWIFRIW